MTKGKFGFNLSAIAVIAFGFAALRQPQSVLLVAGFALLAEKDEWLNRQTMQALLLTIAYYLAELAINWVFGGLARFFGWVKLYGAAGAMSAVDTFVGDILYLALIVFSVLAVLRVLRGRDAVLPIVSKMADGDFASAIKQQPGAAAPFAQTIPSAQVPPVGAQYAPQEQPSASVRAAPAAVQTAPAPAQAARAAAVQVAPAPAVRLCSNCSAPLEEGSRFCTECGAKTE